MTRLPTAASLMLFGLFLVACVGNTAILRSTGDGGGRMQVSPPVTTLPAVDAGVWGEFQIEVRGRDVLSGLRWTPGFGSRLDVEERDIDEGWPAGPDGGLLTLRYRLIGPAAPAWDSGAPADVGVLRLFFEEHPTVDVRVEVVE